MLFIIEVFFLAHWAIIKGTKECRCLVLSTDVKDDVDVEDGKDHHHQHRLKSSRQTNRD